MTHSHVRHLCTLTQWPAALETRYWARSEKLVVVNHRQQQYAHLGPGCTNRFNRGSVGILYYMASWVLTNHTWSFGESLGYRVFTHNHPTTNYNHLQFWKCKYLPITIAAHEAGSCCGTEKALGDAGTIHGLPVSDRSSKVPSSAAMGLDGPMDGPKTSFVQPESVAASRMASCQASLRQPPRDSILVRSGEEGLELAL